MNNIDVYVHYGFDFIQSRMEIEAHFNGKRFFFLLCHGDNRPMDVIKKEIISAIDMLFESGWDEKEYISLHHLAIEVAHLLDWEVRW